MKSCTHHVDLDLDSFEASKTHLTLINVGYTPTNSHAIYLCVRCIYANCYRGKCTRSWPKRLEYKALAENKLN